MKILIVGSGGREHALVTKCLESTKVTEIIVAPGNEGMVIPGKVSLAPVKATDVEGLLGLAKDRKVDFTIVGPEAALEKGIVDSFENEGMCIFGPSKKAAGLEFSKAFAKSIMQKAGVKTAAYVECVSLAQALSEIEKFPQEEIVVKANGLAAGKGVFVCDNKEQAMQACENLLSKKEFAVKADKVLLETRLYGREVSAFALCDGEKATIIGHACDYKRLEDFGNGPNTGGMGAYSPVNWLDTPLKDQLQKQVFDKMMKQMKVEGIPFKGVLYAGLMVDKNEDGLWEHSIIEFNTRFGDPETQVVLPLIDEDLVELMVSAAKGELPSRAIKLKNKTAVHLVLAAKGYPGIDGKQIEKGMPINTVELAADEYLFYAGVSRQNEKLQTNGGRVLGLTTLGRNRMQARDRAYRLKEKINFSGAQFRSDIGL